MAFRLYTDKSSVRKKNSRYVQGGESDSGVKFIRWWERESLGLDEITDLTYIIPVVYAGLPDLIAYDYYGRNDLGWLVLQYNNIVDVNEELAVGKTIKLPDKGRVFYSMLSSPIAARRLSS